MTATALHNIQLGACTQDPDRWTTTPDAEAKALEYQRFVQDLRIAAELMRKSARAA